MFRRKQQADAEGFVMTGVSVGDLHEGQMLRTKVRGKTVVLTLLEGAVVAFSDTCPHGASSLSAGSLRGGEVRCPEHGYCFDLRSGRITWPADEVYRLSRYEARLEDGYVKLRPESR